MEMEETDSAKLMTNLILTDIRDPPIMPELQVNSRENDCLLLETDDISTTNQRKTSNINMNEERKDHVNDMEKRESDEPLPIDVLNVPEIQDCSSGKGKE